MSSAVWIVLVAVAVAALLLPQAARVFGAGRGALLTLAATAIGLGGWFWLGSVDPVEVEFDLKSASVPAADCAKCHADHYQSWYRTYHRSMTRDAAADTIKGNFADSPAIYDYQGFATRFTRKDGSYFMETVDPVWAAHFARAKGDKKAVPPPHYTKYKIDRLVGSHWIQEYLHRDTNGTYHRLPVLYHIVERRWIHSNGAFLVPDSDDFWNTSRGTVWNNTCLYCHNTGPASNPVPLSTGQRGYQTEVAELGISCEACHGPAGTHVELNQNPARRFELQQAGKGDPSIVNPNRLSVERRDEVCARCHGALVPKPEMWPRNHKDPFIAGQPLKNFNHYFSSEAEQRKLAGVKIDAKSVGTEPLDGRFWGDGTPLTTALEFNGMSLSACYQNGHGGMSCLSCHSMHADEPNFLLKPGMKTNKACVQCHESHGERLAEHTRHMADSAGSQCVNCHMPHLVYSLLNTHRSHRIETPDLKTTLETGKPHACNLCHLDKSLGWTQEQMARWPNRQKDAKLSLSADEKNISAAVLWMTRGDARLRVMVAGAFSQPGAHAAGGADWYGPFLPRLMEGERFPAIRYLLHRGLRSVNPGELVRGYDYLAAPQERQKQLLELRNRLDALPISGSRPYLPLTAEKLPDDQVLRRLLEKRADPDLTINE